MAETNSDRKLQFAIGLCLFAATLVVYSSVVHHEFVNYDDLIDDVSVGNVILVDNGVMQLRVLAKKDNRIRCTVLTAGTLGSRRHINLPGVHVNLPALTEKDLADITLGAELGVDFVALSFARKKGDLDELRRFILSEAIALRELVV